MTISGALIWVSTFLTLGYLLGEQWQSAAENAHKLILIATIVLVLAGLVYWLIKRRKA